MKRFFYLGIFLLLAFEIARIYFILPLPGSQQLDTVTLAHFLHTWRWPIRIILALTVALGIRQAWQGRKAIVITTAALAALLIGFIHLKMSADKMFLQPQQRSFLPASTNQLPENQLIIGIEHAGEARAYPIQLIAYHHQVLDTLGGKPVMVTYCSVCRSGRVFEPIVKGKQEQFRLVGMDHFNALFEDASTGSWWRQATGEAVAGPCKGQSLPEWPIVQTTLGTWLRLHPNTTILQPDPHFQADYQALEGYESGTRPGGLTGRDTTAGKDKSWIVGLEVGHESKAYDWNDLQRKRIIHDEIDGTPIVLALASDNHSFFAFQRPNKADSFQLRGDTLVSQDRRYALNGMAMEDGTNLIPIRAYQEFLHSWRSFH